MTCRLKASSPSGAGLLSLLLPALIASPLLGQPDFAAPPHPRRPPCRPWYGKNELSHGVPVLVTHRNCFSIFKRAYTLGSTNNSSSKIHLGALDSTPAPRPAWIPLCLSLVYFALCLHYQKYTLYFIYLT